MQPILIILQTYERTAYALETIRAAKANLRYPLPLKWFVTDDGSRPDHVREIESEIGGESLIGKFSQRVSYGTCGNQAWKFASHNGFGLTLWLEDDWKLRQPLDLALYAAVLEQNQDVGMVRLGRIPPWLDCHTDAYNGAVYLWYQFTTPYAFSGNPSLRHRRFHEAYGDYPEREQPGETERIYEAHVREIKDGPKILAPVDLGTYGAFQHIGDVKSF